MPVSSAPRWILLIHQIPPKPDYFRVKIWRRLQRLGAVAIKNSVYVLPWSDQAVEDFQWVLREIASGGGDAAVCEARFVDGLTDRQVEALFHQARAADYQLITSEARRLSGGIVQDSTAAGERRAPIETEVARLRRRFAEVTSIDHFSAPGRAAAQRLIVGLERRLKTRPGVATTRPGPHASTASGGSLPSHRRGRIWVTRRDVHIDRIACAWLIRRFIDPKARFKFVPAAGYRPAPREVRFDMYEAEFTHDGDRCTFEVLVDRFRPDDAALRPIAEIVHDIDLKDSRYQREERPGIERLIAGALARRDDDERIVRAADLFDDLYECFREKQA